MQRGRLFRYHQFGHHTLLHLNFDARRRDNPANPLACLFTSILMRRMDDPSFTSNFDPRMGGLSSTSTQLNFNAEKMTPPPTHHSHRLSIMDDHWRPSLIFWCDEKGNHSLHRSNVRWRGFFGHRHPPLNADHLSLIWNVRCKGCFGHHHPPLPHSNTRRGGAFFFLIRSCS